MVARQSNAKNDADEPEVQPHVAVENVAEFVADDALQFVARKHFMQPRVTATAASPVVWPAAKALMPSSSSST